MVNRKPWNLEDDIELAELKMVGYKTSEIAVLLGRSRSAIYHRCRRLGANRRQYISKLKDISHKPLNRPILEYEEFKTYYIYYKARGLVGGGKPKAGYYQNTENKRN